MAAATGACAHVLIPLRLAWLAAEVSVSLSKRQEWTLTEGVLSKQSAKGYFSRDLLGGLHIRKIPIVDIIGILV